MKFEHTICGIFDVTGFYNGKSWLPHEGALPYNNDLVVFNIDHDQKFDCLSESKENASEKGTK